MGAGKIVVTVTVVHLDLRGVAVVVAEAAVKGARQILASIHDTIITTKRAVEAVLVFHCPALLHSRTILVQETMVEVSTATQRALVEALVEVSTRLGLSGLTGMGDTTAMTRGPRRILSLLHRRGTN